MRLAILSILVPLAGCVTASGKKIESTDVKKLVVGKSTYAMVIKKFGEPRVETEVEGACGPNTSGKVLQYSYASMFDRTSQGMTLRFNAKDVLCAKPMLAKANGYAL